MRSLPTICAALCMTLALGVCSRIAQAAPSDTNSADRAAIEQIVRDLLKQHPEIVEAALADAQAQDQAAAQQKLADAAQGHLSELENMPADPVLGAEHGKVTVVEFTDYQCPYCKAMAEPLRQLLESDNRVRLVIKEVAVFGPVSEEAAKIALAAKAAGKFADVHRQFFALTAPMTDEKLRSVAAESGLDKAAVDRALANPAFTDAIHANMELGKTLQITGTPTFFIGHQAINGAPKPGVLEDAVNDAANGIRPKS